MSTKLLNIKKQCFVWHEIIYSRNIYNTIIVCAALKTCKSIFNCTGWMAYRTNLLIKESKTVSPLIVIYDYLIVNINFAGRRSNNETKCPLATVHGAFYMRAKSTFINSWTRERHGSTRVPGHAFLAWRTVAHDGVLSTVSNRSAPDLGKWCGPSIIYKMTPCCLLGHSPPASQTRRCVGPAF